MFLINLHVRNPFHNAMFSWLRSEVEVDDSRLVAVKKHNTVGINTIMDAS